MRNRRDKPARGVRPTTAKVLESLLAILRPMLDGVRAVDLFAGTGQVGLRFLEGGASSVHFVEGSPEVARALQGRLKDSRTEGAAHLVRGKIPSALKGLPGPFDLFWADPPYDWDSSALLLPALAPLAAAGAVLVVEHHHKTPYRGSHGWRLYRERDFGETRLSFFRRAEDSSLVDPANESEDQGAKGEKHDERTGVVRVQFDDMLGDDRDTQQAEKSEDPD